MADVLAFLLVCGVVFLPAQASAQHMDYAARQRMEAEVAGLTGPQAAVTPAEATRAIMTSVGLTWAAPAVPQVKVPPFVADTKAVIELVDIRLLLTQIAIQTGARDHVALVRAQGAREHDVILLRGGFVRLPDLRAIAEGTAAQDFIIETPEGIMLTRPLAVWSDAGLTLAAADHLILDRASGSFVANLGWVNLSGGTISGNDSLNTAEADFRPFVMTAGRGSFTAQAASFRTLGFGDAAVFGGISVANNGLEPSRLASVIVDSSLQDVRTVGLIGTTSSIVASNRIEASSGTAVLISDAQATIVAANTLTGLSAAQAIRVTAGSVDVQISGNFLSGEARTGILIDRGSHAVAVDSNLVAGSQTAGIVIEAATCVTLAGNLVARNGGTGISLTKTDGIVARNNAILFNKSSGILVRDQAATATAHVASNVLIGNRDGMRGATSGDLSLQGNQLDGQMPRIFAGDLAPLTVDWLRDRRLAVPVATPLPSPAPCAIQGNG